MLKVLIDADGCPVVDIAVKLCRQRQIPCFLLCDTAHSFQKEGAETLTFDKGADSVDFALVNRVSSGDIVVTQDYGLASMCLARKARVLHQDGWEYTADNIDARWYAMIPGSSVLPVDGPRPSKSETHTRIKALNGAF